MIEVNLLPVREERRKADMQQQAILLVLTLAGSLLLVAGYHSVLTARVAGARSSAARLQAKIDEFGPQLKQVEQFRATKAEIEKKLQVIERLDKSRSGPVHVLDELATHTPERVWLTKLQTGRDLIEIEGVSLDNELVALLLTALEDSPYFQKVELEETKLVEKERLKLNAFRLQAQLTTPGLDDTTQTAAIPAPRRKGL